jgi:carboxylesterase type B
MDTYFLIALVVCLCVTKTMANPTLGVRSDPLVQTSQGAFRGAHVDQDVDAFLGIPYAQPPIGRLRFLPAEPMKPEPDSNSSTISDATHFGPVCYQFIHRSVLGDAILPTTEQSEDCLTLNIFRPRNASCHGQLPVFVWSFGGAFAEGGGSVPLYNPSGFVAENKDIILVTWK